jgi:hypothetical protein
MNTGSSGIRRIVIAPNGYNNFDAVGQYLQVVTAIDPVHVTIDQMAEMTLRAGCGTKTPEPYSVLVFHNPLPKRVAIEVWIGVTEFIDQRVDQVEAPYFIKSALPDGVLAADTTLVLDGEPPDGTLRRKSVQISNQDNNVPLEILDTSGAPSAIVRMGETITIPGSGVVKIRNTNQPGGEAIQCRICEYWYTL